jgi:hypothetical protein
MDIKPVLDKAVRIKRQKTIYYITDLSLVKSDGIVGMVDLKTEGTRYEPITKLESAFA